MNPAPGASALHDVTTALPREAPARRRAWAAFALTFAAFVATVAGVGALVPRRAWLDGSLRAKLDLFAVEKDDVEILVAGSSHLYRGIDPRVLDARLAERGFPVRSHNLAFTAASSIEADTILRQALALRPARLRWVVVELRDPLPFIREPDAVRTVGWHDLRGTTAGVRASLLSRRTAVRKAELAAQHLAAFAARATSLGIGPEVVRVLAGTEDEDYRGVVEVAAGGHGYAPYENEYRERTAAARRRKFVAETKEYESRVARVRAGDASARRRMRTLPHSSRWLRAQRDAVRAAGAEIVYVVCPQLERVPLSAANLRADGPIVLGFDDPAKFPELFESAHRFDRTHMNSAGAALLSRHLADALADRVIGRKP